MTMTNGTLPTITTPATACPCRLPTVALAELDDWDSTIADLDRALADAAAARRDLLSVEAETELLEARAVLAVTGGNAETRKATVAVQLAESVAYQDLVAEAREARARLADAERRVLILRQRCHVHRAAIHVALGQETA